MAAPNIAEPYQPGGYQHEAQLTEQDDPEQQSADRARADRIAELAARLAVIEARDRATGSAARTDDRAGPRPAAPSGSWASVPIGSSGSTGSPDRRRGAPGGHSEDAPGDPAAVARAICLRLLTGAARPRAALAAALRQRGIPDDVAAAVLDRFVEVGLIDDEAYAAAFVAAKHRDRALGVTALRTELRRKGVDEVTVDAAVQVVDSEAERDRARALISRRVDAAMSNGIPAARRRLVGLLARRGYSAELSGQVVDEALAEYGAEQDDGWSN